MPTIYIATRGSALALAQANLVMQLCREAAPAFNFDLKIIKTTGDKLQTAPAENQYQQLPKGLFTKEIEEALLQNEASMAVHSLKDLPTDLPPGLMLTAVLEREDVRDVLIYRKNNGGQLRGFGPGLTLKQLPSGAVVATSSTRRQAAVTTANPGLKAVPIRGNVGTRIQKILTNGDYDVTLLAAAGLHRLHYKISADGTFTAPNGNVENVWAAYLQTEEVLPCVGQAAIGIETRENDEQVKAVLKKLNHSPTLACVTAERAFLKGMGGGCQSPVAAHAILNGKEISMSVISYREKQVKKAHGKRDASEAVQLGIQLADAVKN